MNRQLIDKQTGRQVGSLLREKKYRQRQTNRKTEKERF